MNNGENQLKVKPCDLDINHGFVCSPLPPVSHDYGACDSFIPEQTSVTLRLDANVTYIMMLYCVETPTRNYCLQLAAPLEAYRNMDYFPHNGGWPFVMTIPASERYCDSTEDCCKGETCVPNPACSPSTGAGSVTLRRPALLASGGGNPPPPSCPPHICSEGLHQLHQDPAGGPDWATARL